MAKHDKARRANRRITKLASALRAAMVAEIKMLKRLGDEASEAGDRAQAIGFAVQALTLYGARQRGLFATCGTYRSPQVAINHDVRVVRPDARLLTASEAAALRASIGW